MYVTWELVKLILAGFLAVCAGFSCVCVAGGWLIKIIKGIRKPSKDMHEMVTNNDNRIKDLESKIDYISSSIGVLMRSNLVILAHMRTNNETGKIAKMEAEITEFLIER